MKLFVTTFKEVIKKLFLTKFKEVIMKLFVTTFKEVVMKWRLLIGQNDSLNIHLWDEIFSSFKNDLTHTFEC